MFRRFKTLWVSARRAKNGSMPGIPSKLTYVFFRLVYHLIHDRKGNTKKKEGEKDMQDPPRPTCTAYGEVLNTVILPTFFNHQIDFIRHSGKNLLPWYPSSPSRKLRGRAHPREGSSQLLRSSSYIDALYIKVQRSVCIKTLFNVTSPSPSFFFFYSPQHIFSSSYS